MKFCINPKAQKVIDLAKELNLPANVTAAKAGYWMNKNKIEDFPRKEQLLYGQGNDKIYYQNNSTKGIVASEKTIRDVAYRMADRIGIDVKFVSDRTQDWKGKLRTSNGAWDSLNSNAKLVAEINLAYATLDTPIHEILGHPIIRAIKGIVKVPYFNHRVMDLRNDKNAPDNFAVEYQDNISEDGGADIDFFKTQEEVEAFINKKTTPTKTGNQSLYENLLKELETGIGREVLDRIKQNYKTKGIPIPDYVTYLHQIEQDLKFTFNGDIYELIHKRFSYGWGAEAKKNGELFKGESNESSSNFIKFYNQNSTQIKEILNRDKTYSLEEQEEEALVELLGLYTANKLDAIKDRNLIDLLRELLKNIASYVKALLKSREVDVSKLSDNITLRDLSDILAYSNSKLILPGYAVKYTTPDNENFKTYVEASKHISNLVNNIHVVNPITQEDYDKYYEQGYRETGDFDGEFPKLFKRLEKKEADLSNVKLVKELTDGQLKNIAKLEKELEDIKKELASEEYASQKAKDINDIEQKIKKVKERENVFKYQEPNAHLKGFTFGRIQHTQSPIRIGDHTKQLPPGYEGYYIFAYNTGKNEVDKKIVPISDEDALKAWIDQGSEVNVNDRHILLNLENDLDRVKRDGELGMKLRNKQSEIKHIKLNDNPIKSFLDKNREFEQAQEIIEEWKKVNNIQYDPEEIYSRGQGFYSIMGAYSSFDVDLLFQNILSHIEDNEKAGGEFTISAITRSVDNKQNHEGISGRIRFRIFPKSKDIKWAANRDVYSGSTWDASKKISKDKAAELVGVSYTKAPSLKNISAVQPNLTAAVDNSHFSYNELGISLTGGNFRLEYDDDIPYQTKKLIDSINKILVQKFGEIKIPALKTKKTYHVQYKDLIEFDDGTIMKIGDDTIDFDTEKEAKLFLAGFSKDYKTIYSHSYEYIDRDMHDGAEWQATGVIQTLNKEDFTKKGIKDSEITSEDYPIYAKLIIKEVPIIKKPTQLRSTLKEDITSIEDRMIQHIGQDEYDGYFEDTTGVRTKQAIINTKIARLKEIARAHPRSLIRSEIVTENEPWYKQNPNWFEDELPFQKVALLEVENRPTLMVKQEERCQ